MGGEWEMVKSGIPLSLDEAFTCRATPSSIPETITQTMATERPLAKPISECFIRPKQEVDESKEVYHLAPADICFLAAHYCQRGLLFNKPPNFDINSFVDNLKSALSFALLHFYPLAGRFTTVKCEDEDACWVYVDCNKGPGVRFIHAASPAATVADVLASPPDLIPLIQSFFELGEEDVINVDGHTRALLSLQVTDLIDGVFIGFTMNHSMVDGTSLWHFINSLSEIFNSLDEMNQGKMTLSHAPIIKPIFPEGHGSITKLPCPNFKGMISRHRMKMDPHLRQRIFHFSGSSIARLKAKANAECCDGSSAQISSFQSLSGLVWRSINRARNLGPDVVSTCMIVADARTRFNPPLPKAHFGNLILAVQGSCKVGELLENGLGWAAWLLHQHILSINEEKAGDRGKALLDLFLGPQPDFIASIAGGRSAVVIGGSVRFNVYGPKFGFGRVVASRTGYSAKTDGKVLATPGCDGEGSVELEISLSPQAMIALEQDQEFMSFVSSS